MFVNCNIAKHQVNATNTQYVTSSLTGTKFYCDCSAIDWYYINFEQPAENVWLTV